MKRVIVHNINHPQMPPLEAGFCSSFLCRLRGLTFRWAINPQEGLLLVQGRESRLDAAIHMLGVFTDLAVTWINTSGEVVDVRLARRWRPAYIPKRPARYILETNPTRFNDFKIGDHVSFEEL